MKCDSRKGDNANTTTQSYKKDGVNTSVSSVDDGTCIHNYQSRNLDVSKTSKLLQMWIERDDNEYAEAKMNMQHKLVPCTDTSYTATEIFRMMPFTSANIAQSTSTQDFWYNDNIINPYIGFLRDRDVRHCVDDDCKKPSLFFNSFFMERLLDTDKAYKFDNVKRWSKKMPFVLECDKVCTIVNLGDHWAVLLLRVDEKRIEYYDHMNRNSRNGIKYLNGMRAWLKDEVCHKGNGKYFAFDIDEWRTEDMSTFIPESSRQSDSHSCGPFALICLDLLVQDLLFDQVVWYTQNDMQTHFRRKIICDHYRGKLTY